MSALRAAALALLMLAAPALAQADAQAEPEDLPEPGAALVDPDFKVGTREFGLDRQVEMYQWHASERGYERVWHGAAIESHDFAAGHENPPQMLLDNRRWWAEKPTLDGKPLDPSVLRTLGEWRVLQPNFSRLPANLAASFQPEGDGLGSAENPLDPQIGDLRVSWRELVLPPLAGKVVLREGAWRLADDAAVGGIANAPVTPGPARTQRLWPFLGAALLAIIGLLAFRRRRKAHDQEPG